MSGGTHHIVVFDAEDIGADIAMMQVASAPVVPNAPQVMPTADEAAVFDWFANYTDPDVNDLQASAPVQANAPPNPFVDPWSWQDAELEEAWQLGDDDDDPVGPGAVSTARQDYGDSFLAFEDHWEPTGIPAGYQQQNGTPPPEPRALEDAPTFDVEVEDDFFDDFGNIDADNACPDDAWNWDYDDLSPDELVLVVAVDSEPVHANAAAPADLAEDDPWDWTDDAPAEDWPAIVCDSDDAVGTDAVFEIASPDAFDWTPDALEDAEYSSEPVGADAGAPDVQQPGDDWTYVLDFDEPFEADSAPVGPDAVEQGTDFEWPWSDDLDDAEELYLSGETVGENGPAADIAPEDAWPWASADETDDAEEAFSEPGAVAADDSAPDALDWGWDAEVEDPTAELVASSVGPVGANNDTPPEDAWPWDDFGQDVTLETTGAGDVVGENFVPPLIDVRETFLAQADQTTFYPAIEADTFATPQDQDTFTPL